MASTAIRPIGHEDRLSIVEHLDELRRRLMVSAAVLIVAFSICAWQNKALLDFIGQPLATQTEHRTEQGQGLSGGIYIAQRAVRRNLVRDIAALDILARDRSIPASGRTELMRLATQARGDLRALPNAPPPNRPVTLGIGEPFTQTITIAGYFAILFALPFLLYQFYAFILPAFSPRERKLAIPLMSMIPFLFVAGVIFSYIVVLPAATRFLQNFNSDQFNVLVQAKDYYKFAILTLVSLGLVFQLPVGILAITRLGLVTVAQLRQYRRYAIVATAVLAMVLPGTDPVSMIIEFLILYALYEVSVLAAGLMDRSKAKADAAERAEDDAFELEDD